MKLISKFSEKFNYSSYYNIYAIPNEIHPTANLVSSVDGGQTEFFLDDYYGRLFNQEYMQSTALYGLSSKMGLYVNVNGLELVDEYRVPYRKIPIFQVDSADQIKILYRSLIENNRGYEVLLRGQANTYFIGRDESENIQFYGQQCVNEPSFLPSHLRSNFDDLFIESMWHNQAAILLNDIGYDYERTLRQSSASDYWNDVYKIRNSPLFTAFSLGIAQHYGLPSVGLDLTDSIGVASWFALNKILVNESGYASISPIDSTENITPTLFVFRCPKDSVYNYEVVKPKMFPIARPDKQKAWFGHVGWGEAKNQLGSYLMCGFRLSEKYVYSIKNHLPTDLFPSISQDPILEFFVKMMNQDKHEGEARRALKRVYYTK
jgi:hypothetical protein